MGLIERVCWLYHCFITSTGKLQGGMVNELTGFEKSSDGGRSWIGGAGR